MKKYEKIFISYFWVKSKVETEKEIIFYSVIYTDDA